MGMGKREEEVSMGQGGEGEAGMDTGMAAAVAAAGGGGIRSTALSECQPLLGCPGSGRFYPSSQCVDDCGF